MIELSVNKFRANLKDFVDKAIEEHQPIRVNRREGKDFIKKTNLLEIIGRSGFCVLCIIEN